MYPEGYTYPECILMYLCISIVSYMLCYIPREYIQRMYPERYVSEMQDTYKIHSGYMYLQR
jgi:hypothetical protein